MKFKSLYFFYKIKIDISVSMQKKMEEKDIFANFKKEYIFHQNFKFQ